MINIVRYFKYGRYLLRNPHFIEGIKKTQQECDKNPSRTQVINFLLSLFDRDTNYLEIGVRDPDVNYNHINAHSKHSVDPGIEFKENPVDFKLTSDSFFEKLERKEILVDENKFDVIFIDGLHLADQVDRDIKNALNFIKDDGFIVLHDCNPPTQWHAREEYGFQLTPAKGYWNGTTWKAFLKWRFNAIVNSCCVDTDWGVGILSKKHAIGNCINESNPFFEFEELERNRKESLNLISFNELKDIFN